MPRFPLLPLALLLSAACLPAAAATPQDAHGLWLSADKAAVIEFKDCADAPGALCGQIVWDKDAGTPTDACGVRIAKLKSFDGEAWRDGWVHDPRDKKNYKGAVRVKGGGSILAVRAYIGTEVLGETEEMTRTNQVPAGCKAR
ncbi:DUF2147 domain-containing protein [Ottowia testudinis]|uniref:DUF2147 domain-containing protein n=1 Tax=Ottowia testudinis TaxID=2816950 RepID=A0A975H4F2_9BURK|nr:DUF2147 domain-containing protein [Ottowia testudinis]QTD46305.1 DUF2147 domain-containing protein [Ottowia testudinis]